VRREVSSVAYVLRAWTSTRLDVDRSQGPGHGDDRLEDGAQLGAVTVLPLDELVGRREQVVRIAERLHHQEHLPVPGHAVLGEPAAQRGLVDDPSLGGDPLVPPGDVVPGLADEPLRDRGPHLLPAARRHRPRF
jgi:hypothetical protein